MQHILIDQNLSRNLCAVLAECVSKCTHVGEVGLIEAQDEEVWRYAKHNSCCILTKDWGFKFMSILYGCPPKAIRLACGNRTTTYIQNLLLRQTGNIMGFLIDPGNCYLEIE